MILKGSQRGGAKQLAIHLLNTRDNEHAEVHELRGFLADDLQSAFHEAYAVSRGTRARQFLFSLSLNPPPHEKVSITAFEKAIDQVEQGLGLEHQPRAIVFHEKEGRRHAHVVSSRIDAQHMKAINLPFYKLKLREVSKELFLEHGWQMPRGFIDSRERDPATYSLAEWQQAKRGGHDPKAPQNHVSGMLGDFGWAQSICAGIRGARIYARARRPARPCRGRLSRRSVCDFQICRH